VLSGSDRSLLYCHEAEQVLEKRRADVVVMVAGALVFVISFSVFFFSSISVLDELRFNRMANRRIKLEI
jgi:hypothetical protein